MKRLLSISLLTLLGLSSPSIHSQNSYNLPLEISEIALGGRGGDGGTDKGEFVVSTSSFGSGSSASMLAEGFLTNNGVDLNIVVGWYSKEFGYDPISIRMLNLKPSPTLYSPQSLFVNSYLNTRILSTDEDEFDEVVGVQIARSNGGLIKYEQTDPNTPDILYPVGKESGYSSYLVKVSNNEFERCDGTGTKVIYYVDNPTGTKYRSRFGRTVDVNSSSIDHEVVYELLGGVDAVRQVKTAQTLADVVVVNPFKFKIDFYKDTQVGPKDSNGLYTTPGSPSPYATWTIENPTQNDTDYDELKVTKTTPYETSEFIYQYDTNSGWKLISGDGNEERSENRSSYHFNSETVINEFVTRNSSGVEERSYSETISELPFGEAVTKRTFDSSEGPINQSFEYFQDPVNLNNYGKLKNITNYNFSSFSYEYDTSGRLISKSVDDLAPGYDEVNGASPTIYEYSYDPVDPNDNLPASEKIPRKTLIKDTGNVIGIYFTSYILETDGSEATIINERSVTHNGSFGDPGNVRTTTKIYGYGSGISSVSEGRTKSVLYATGKLDSFSYSEDGNGYVTTTIIEGTELSPAGIPYKTHKVEVTVDDKGNQISKKMYVFTGGSNYQLISESSNTYDDLHNLTKSERRAFGDSNWKVLYEATWEGTKKLSETGQDGVHYTYEYDSLNQLNKIVKEGTGAFGSYAAQSDIEVNYFYNAAGDMVQKQLTADGSSINLTQFYEYDLAGRLQKTTAPGGYETTVSYSKSGRDKQITLANGASYTMTQRVDGLPEKMYGDAVVDRYWDYAAAQDINTSTRVRIFEGEMESERATIYSYDLLGRPVMHQYAALDRENEDGSFWNQNRIERHFHYDSRDLLVRVTTQNWEQKLMADTLYEYDELGNLIRVGMDIDGDGVLTDASSDRISEGSTEYIFDSTSGAWYFQKASLVYADVNSAQATLIGISRVRLTHFESVSNSAGDLVAESISEDIHGNESKVQTFVDRGNKVVTTMADSPVSNIQAKQVHHNGQLVESNGFTVASSTTFGYDAIGRSVSVTDPRLGTSYYGYNQYGQLSFVTNPANETIQYSYYGNGDSRGAGRVSSIENSLNQKVYLEYTQRGELKRRWGELGYPAEFVYDNVGQRTELHTFRGGSGWHSPIWPSSPGTSDKTTWEYDFRSGLVLSQTDALNNQMFYDYNILGQLTEFQNARGQTATMTYDPMTAELLHREFSDGSIAHSFEFDRLGRMVGSTDASGSVSLNHGASLQLEEMQFVGMGLQKSFFFNYETAGSGIAGRTAGYTLEDNVSTATDHQITVAYDAQGRLSSIEDMQDRFDYTYLANSNLISSVANADLQGHGTVLNRTHTWESDRNALTSVANSLNGSNLATYDYTYDAVGRIATEQFSGSAFTSTYHNVYQYNDQGQLTDSDAFQGAVGGSGAAIPDKSFEYVYDRIGNRVEVNSTNQEFARDYTNTNALNQIGTVLSFSGNKSYTYDADGNLTSDGVWTYSWNVSNQMTSMESVGLGKKLEFTYDNQGRRVRKEVYSWGGSSWNSIPDSDEKFLYSGWQPVAVYDGLNNNALLRTYTWGQSLYGPGGIGALLSMEVKTGATAGKYFYSYDAKGNVSQVIKAETGDVVAKYEYDPYGNLISNVEMSGYEDLNNYRFQTKYLDLETGIVYFEHRYYSTLDGRFLNRDPLGVRGGMNLYGYVGNDPINGRDYLGLCRLDDMTEEEIYEYFMELWYGPNWDDGAYNMNPYIVDGNDPDNSGFLSDDEWDEMFLSDEHGNDDYYNDEDQDSGSDSGGGSSSSNTTGNSNSSGGTEGSTPTTTTDNSGQDSQTNPQTPQNQPSDPGTQPGDQTPQNPSNTQSPSEQQQDQTGNQQPSQGNQSNNKSSATNVTDKANTTAGGAAAGLSKSESTFRVTDGKANGNKISPKVYESGWKGGSRAQITTHSLSNVAKLGGRVSTVTSAGIGIYNVRQANIADGGTFGENTQRAIFSEGGGFLGNLGGTAGGAAIGATIGSGFFGIGAVPGAIVGGVIGGLLGSWGGSEAGEAIYNGITDSGSEEGRQDDVIPVR